MSGMVNLRTQKTRAQRCKYRKKAKFNERRKK